MNQYFGYKIAELGSVKQNISSWCLVKENSESADFIVFSSKLIMDEEAQWLVQQLRFKEKYEVNINIFNIALIDENKIMNPEEITDTLSNNLSNIHYVLLDYNKNVILKYNNELSDLEKELSSCLLRIRETSNSKNMRNVTPITLTLIILNILMYLITALLSGGIIDSDINVLVFLGAKVNSLIKSGEYYRLITSMFLHGGIIHLALNMYALYVIGPIIEKLFGKIKFILIYFIGGITASLFSYLFSTSVSIGASGAIFALLGAALVFGIKMRKNIGRDFLRNIFSVIVVNLIIGFSIPNVDNFGHLGGLIGGTLISFVLSTQPFSK
jgi:rhomboid protease GluP